MRKIRNIFLIADSQICSMLSVEKITTLQVQEIDKLWTPDNKETVTLFLCLLKILFYFTFTKANHNNKEKLVSSYFISKHSQKEEAH